jgi:TRAP-type C4-dicarboxylate transport system permease small subunit
MIDVLDAFSRRLAHASAALASVFLAAMVGLIMVEIALRNLFSVSTGFTDEFVAYGVSVITFLGLARALETGVLVRVNLLLDAVGGRRRHALEVASSAVALLLFGFLTWHIGLVAWRDFALGRTSGSMASTPLWIPEGLLLVGLTVFIVRLFVHGLVAARKMRRDEKSGGSGPSEAELIHG